MSDFSVGEELSDSSSSSGEGESSPKFCEDEDNFFNAPSSHYPENTKTAKLSRDAFEIAQDQVNNDVDDYQEDKRVRTFYRPEKPQLIPPNKSNKQFNNSSEERPEYRNLNRGESSKNKQEQKTNPFSRKSDVSNGKDNENDELKFILSHSNTFLTSDMPDNGKKNDRNVIDIDEDSNEAYEDFAEHFEVIDK